MPRKLKPFKVREFTHESGETFEIFMDRNTNPARFFVEVFGERVEAETEHECKKTALAKATEMVAYQWRKIIVASTGHSYHELDKVALNYRIHEIAESVNDGYWVERHTMGPMPFMDDKSVRFHIKQYNYSRKSDSNRGIYVLDWTEELEEALKEIKRRIKTLAEQLEELLGRDDAADLLVMSLNRMLPAPETEETDG